MSERKKRIYSIIVFGLVIVFGFGQFFAGVNLKPPADQSNQAPTSTTPSTATSTLSTTPPTQVMAFSAVPPASAVAVPTKAGSCFASSVAAPYRKDAWRCSVGNAISDPCFNMTGTSTLLCGANPLVADATSTFLLKLTSALPKAEVPSGAVPTNWAWRVKLADGVTCSPFTGTRAFAKTGEIAIYNCDTLNPNGEFIFGDLNDSSTIWTAEVGTLSKDAATFPPVIVASTTIPVAQVWQ